MLTTFINKLITKLKEYKFVALFVHIQPDFDALAAAFGVKQGLKDNFPEIVTYLMIPSGSLDDKARVLFKNEEVLPNEAQLSKCLGIVLDTPTEQRILTMLHVHCKELVVIDHHPKNKSFSELEFIDPTYPAVSQILAEIFFYLESKEGGEYIFNEKLAQYFYAGIITDTNHFLSLSMLPSTYQVLSKIVSKGINRNAIHKTIFEKSLHLQLMEIEFLKNSFITKNGLIFSIINQKMIKKYNVTDAYRLVNRLENISNTEVGTTLIYEPGSKRWKASIRSKDININQIAVLYGGGGHKKMSAVTFSNKCEYYKLLASLDDYLGSNGFLNVTINDEKINFPLRFTKVCKNYRKI